MAILESVSAVAISEAIVVAITEIPLSIEGSLQTLEQTGQTAEMLTAMEGLDVTMSGITSYEETHYATRNEHLEGQLHPDTDVMYNRSEIEANGRPMEGVFPQFEPLAEVALPEELYLSTDARQFSYANEDLAHQIEKDLSLADNFNTEQIEQINNGDTPDNLTWHHHEEMGKLQLVDQEIHAKSGHTGGKAIWGGGSDNR